MATTKKTTAKKTTAKPVAARKTTVLKKVPVKKAPVTKRATKKTTSKASSVKMRSFHVAKDQPPFTSFRITKQTLYWVILVAFIIFAQLWIISLQVEVASLLDTQQAQLQDTY